VPGRSVRADRDGARRSIAPAGQPGQREGDLRSGAPSRIGAFG